jgi:hypothetical protein
MSSCIRWILTTPDPAAIEAIGGALKNDSPIGASLTKIGACGAIWPDVNAGGSGPMVAGGVGGIVGKSIGRRSMGGDGSVDGDGSMGGDGVGAGGGGREGVGVFGDVATIRQEFQLLRSSLLAEVQTLDSPPSSLHLPFLESFVLARPSGTRGGHENGHSCAGDARRYTTDSRIHSLLHSLSCTPLLAHTLSHTLSHAPPYSLTHSLTLSLMHPLTRSHTLSHTLSCAQRCRRCRVR